MSVAARIVSNSPDPDVPAESHADPLQPQFWRHYLDSRRCPDAVVCAPHPAMADMALALFSCFVPCVACMVPKDFLTEAPTPRVEWLQTVQAASRLQVIVATARVPGTAGQRCFVWVCVFSSPAMKHLLLRDEYNTGSSLCFVSDRSAE